MSKRKILIIEDEPDQVTMMKIRLRASGFEVVSALDGEEGLEKADLEHPDLILLDIILPKADGLEVCKRLRQSPDTRTIPIIALTASGVETVEQDCISAGADEYIRKPCESEVLLEKIRRLLNLNSVN